MGQKTNPIGLRLGINRLWDSMWFAQKNFANWLEEDVMIRKYIKKRLARAGVAKIEIERRGDKVRVHIHTARPGMVIGRKGAEVDFLSEEMAHLTGKNVQIDIKEVKRPELNAMLVAEHIAGQIEQRVSYRRAMKKAIGSAMRMGAFGIKLKTSGRLGGAETATDWGFRTLSARSPLYQPLSYNYGAVMPFVSSGFGDGVFPVFALTDEGKRLLLNRALHFAGPLVMHRAGLPLAPEGKQPEPLI